MPLKRRSFKRRAGKLPYRKLFVVSVEGSKTEVQYFSMFNKGSLVVHVVTAKSKSSPPYVLKRMKAQLKKEPLEKSDEAWVVVDKDNWTDESLAKLHAWAQESKNYGFALSNPKFEYWLLLHFEDGNGVATSQECSDRLKVYLPDYDKKIDNRKVSIVGIKNSIVRAKARDNPPCTDWPRNIGVTTVYKLVEKLLIELKEQE